MGAAAAVGRYGMALVLAAFVVGASVLALRSGRAAG